MGERHVERAVSFADPQDPEIVKAIGVIALRQARLDYSLRMVVQSLSTLPPDRRPKITFRVCSRDLRERIVRLARERFGSDDVLSYLEAALEECETATARHNEIMHRIVARQIDGARNASMKNDSREEKPAPSAEEFRGLSDAVTQLVDNLDDGRMHGYLHEAMQRHGA
jgi:hypothetical protein